MNGDLLGKLGELACENLLGSLVQNASALTRGNTAHEKHVLDIVEECVVCNGITEVYTDGLIDLSGTLVALDHEVLNHLRRQKIRAMISLDSATGILAKKIDEDPYFNGDKMQRELHKAMLKLPEKQRIVFSLRYFDEMKYEDMSQITGTSTGALKATYHIAYNKIRKELETLL